MCSNQLTIRIQFNVMMVIDYFFMVYIHPPSFSPFELDATALFLVLLLEALFIFRFRPFLGVSHFSPAVRVLNEMQFPRCRTLHAANDVYLGPVHCEIEIEKEIHCIICTL